MKAPTGDGCRTRFSPRLETRFMHEINTRQGLFQGLVEEGEGEMASQPIAISLGASTHLRGEGTPISGRTTARGLPSATSDQIGFVN